MSTHISVISYALAALAYLVLAVLSLTAWKKRIPGKSLIVACLASSVWAIFVAIQATRGYQATLSSDLLELARNGLWTVFLLILLGPFRKTSSPLQRRVRPATIFLVAFYFVLMSGLIYSYTSPHQYTDYGFQMGLMGFLTSIVGRVMTAIIGIALVEQLYRSAPHGQRWGIIFLCLGVGGIFAYDFFLYSEAMLFRRVDVGLWSARGLVNALIVPLLAISMAREPNWSLSISISRHIILSSTALLAAGVYLLAMGAAGFYIRDFGGNWGVVLQVVFLSGSLALLFLVWSSRRLRSEFRVFISKHFFRYNYDYREEWLRFTRTLSDGRHKLGERAIQAVADLVESPGGALWICKESGLCELEAHWHMPQAKGSEPENSPFCHYIESKNWVIDLHDYTVHPDRYAKFHIPEWLRIIPNARFVMPLLHYGRLFGLVLLAQPRGKVKLNWEISDLLKTACSQAVSHLAQQEADKSLMVARQFASFNRMSTFVVHDLKNLVSQLTLLLNNAHVHKDNPEFQQDMFDTLEHSVLKMKGLLEKINQCSIKIRSGAPITDESVPLSLEHLLESAVAAKSSLKPTPEFEIVDRNLMVQANWSRLERIIGHLIQNAVEATPKDGEVVVRLAQKDNQQALIEVRDTGHGMSEEFIRERLFKPFDSTKPSGMGIGVFEIQEYIREIGGQLDVESLVAHGTTFRVTLPLHMQEQAEC